MAQRFLFFNSTSNDRRKYDAKDFSDYFGSVLSTGVLHVDEQPGLFVSVEQGTMNTIVGPGKAIMKGHLYENTTPHTLTHSLPETNLDRIDRIVLRLDLRQSQRNILLHVKEGQPAENPEPPALQRDNLIYEISLARILVRRNTSSLQPIDLQDERLDEDVCGLVYSLISIPTSQFQEQWETFYNTIKNEMDTETQAYFQQLAQNILQFEQDWDAWFSNQKTEGFVMQNEKGQPNGVASLDENAKVPLEQLPPLDFIPISEKGVPNGVATLDTDRKVTITQLRDNWSGGTYTTTRSFPRVIVDTNDIYTYSIQTFTINVGTEAQEVLFSMTISSARVGYVRVFRSEQNWAVGQSGYYQNFFTRIARTNRGYGSTWTGSEPSETIPYITFDYSSGSYDYRLVDAYLSGSYLTIKVTSEHSSDRNNQPVVIDYMIRR